MKLKNIKLHLRLLTGKLKKTKCRSINIVIRDWNDILHNSEYLKRNSKLNFVIIDVALKRYRL